MNAIITDVELPPHSPLGASGMERWMNCPGSVTLIDLMGLPEADDPDYRRFGTAAHAFAAHCLNTGTDAWEGVGDEWEGVTVDEEMADCVQPYLDECRKYMGEGWQWSVEVRISSPAHAKFYGTVDFRSISPDGMQLVVRDFKSGVGVVVDVENNPQLLYYTYGTLLDAPDIGSVDMGIVQPRGFHPDGGVRTWEQTADQINEWAEAVLFPAMKRTEFDQSLDAGPWCRFCPAKLGCPVLTGMFGAAMKGDPKELPNLSDDMLGRNYQQIQGVKSYIKALESEVLRRLSSGRQPQGTKLVWQRANRVYKPGAVDALKALFGDKCYSKPEFLTPAQLEKVGPTAKREVQKWAYTPQTGLTVALESDARLAVIPTTLAEEFQGVLDRAKDAE